MNRRVRTGIVRTHPVNGRARFAYWCAGVFGGYALLLAIDGWESI